MCAHRDTAGEARIDLKSHRPTSGNPKLYIARASGVKRCGNCPRFGFGRRVRHHARIVCIAGNKLIAAIAEAAGLLPVFQRINFNAVFFRFRKQILLQHHLGSAPQGLRQIIARLDHKHASRACASHGFRNQRETRHLHQPLDLFWIIGTSVAREAQPCVFEKAARFPLVHRHAQHLRWAAHDNRASFTQQIIRILGQHLQFLLRAGQHELHSFAATYAAEFC